VEDLLRLKKDKNCSGFITTEKDVINLGARASHLQPLGVTRVTMELLQADRVISKLLKGLRKKLPS
jgi:tetraacyldisaccharide-1-P 4'-kinase